MIPSSSWRPEWVAEINAGRVWPISEAAAPPFDRAHLLARAAAPLGLRAADVAARLGDEALEALDVLLPALEDEARLSVLGRWITHRFLGRLVEQRLALDTFVDAHPAVAEERITEPWFVIGAPRTGTTILYELLALDPDHRVPRGWELLRPAPSPALCDAADLDVRVELADAELRTPQAVNESLGDIHPYSGTMPKECLSAMSFAFRSEEFTARYHVPSYEAWLATADMRPAYDCHRRTLQVLQYGAPRRRWVLKSPVHLQHLSTLLDVYPDARLSATHRDPRAILGSVSSLIATLRGAHSEDVGLPEIGRYHLELYGRTLDGFVDVATSGLIPAGRLTNTRHADFLADPLGVVGGIYAELGWTLSEPVRQAMADHLVREAHEPGGHRYALATYAIDDAEVVERFARYRAFAGLTVNGA